MKDLEERVLKLEQAFVQIGDIQKDIASLSAEVKSLVAWHNRLLGMGLLLGFAVSVISLIN